MYQLIQYFIMVILFKIIQPILCTVYSHVYVHWILDLKYILLLLSMENIISYQINTFEKWSYIKAQLSTLIVFLLLSLIILKIKVFIETNLKNHLTLVQERRTA